VLWLLFGFCLGFVVSWWLSTLGGGVFVTVVLFYFVVMNVLTLGGLAMLCVSCFVVGLEGDGLFAHAGGVYSFLVGCWIFVCCLLIGAGGCLVLCVIQSTLSFNTFGLQSVGWLSTKCVWCTRLICGGRSGMEMVWCCYDWLVAYGWLVVCLLWCVVGRLFAHGWLVG